MQKGSLINSGLIEYELYSQKIYWTNQAIAIFELAKNQKPLSFTELTTHIKSVNPPYLYLGILKTILAHGSYWGFVNIKTQKKTKALYTLIRKSNNNCLTIYFIDLANVNNNEYNLEMEFKNITNLISYAPFGFILLKNEKIRYYNNKVAQMLGFTRVNELSQWSTKDFIQPHDLKRLLSFIKKQNHKNNLGTNKTTIQIRDKQGNLLFWELFVSNFVLYNNSFSQIMIRDITEYIEYEKKQRHLAAETLYMTQKKNVLQAIKTELEKVIYDNNYPKNNFSPILEIIDSYSKLDKDWNMLITQFEKVEPGFFNRLSKKYPNLSANELKHCACIRMNFDTSETARFFNIKSTSVQMARVRLKKKFKLEETTDLRNFILNL